MCVDECVQTARAVMVAETVALTGRVAPAAAAAVAAAATARRRRRRCRCRSRCPRHRRYRRG